MDIFSIRAPNSDSEYNDYINFRWSTLRKPLGMSKDSTVDEREHNSNHLIGLIDKDIVACGRLHFNTNKQAQIRYMSVDQSIKRRGYGSKILSELERLARLNNAEEIILNAREVVKEFYLANGYIEIAPFKSVTGIAHTTMNKVL